MRWIMICAVVVTLLANRALGDDYYPAGKEWAKLTAAEAGMDAAKLQAAVDFGMAQKSVSVLRHGKIVSETYASDWKPEKRHEIASAAKSMNSILAGMALDEGKFKSLDQSASDFIPAWKTTEKSKITLRHLLSMTSGLSAKGLDVRGIKGDQFALNSAAALDTPPGTKWSYNTPAYHLMFHLIAQATGESFESYAQRKLLGPLDMEQTEWVMNTGTGDRGPVKNYYSASCSARDMARFGLFAMYGGRWHGKQLVSTEYFKLATSTSQQLNPFYGFLWWVNGPGLNAGLTNIEKEKNTATPARLRFPGCPPDTFAALGAFEQDIFVVPSLGLVLVRQGSTPPQLQMGQQLLKRIVESVQPSPGDESKPPITIRADEIGRSVNVVGKLSAPLSSLVSLSGVWVELTEGPEKPGSSLWFRVVEVGGKRLDKPVDFRRLDVEVLETEGKTIEAVKGESWEMRAYETWPDYGHPWEFIKELGQPIRAPAPRGPTRLFGILKHRQ